MRVLVVGAYGLVGGYVTARLLDEGCDVVGLGRDIVAAQRRFPAVRWVQADLRSLDADGWTGILADVDAVVNCAGALQDSPRDNLRAVHVDTVTRLAQACERAGVWRFVQISAVGVERGDDPFRRTKNEADAVLRTTGLDWVVLRPGLVLAPAAYGGSALLRGLAALPIVPAMHARSPVQVVSVEDVAEAVVRSLRAPVARFACDVASSDRTSLGDVLAALRDWLGLPPTRVVEAPAALGAAVSNVADGLAWLGWRSPMRSAAIRQLAAGVVGKGDDTPARLGFTPRGLTETLSRWPAGVQDRWFARLYFLKPSALAVLAAFWALSGLIGFANHATAAQLLTDAGFSSRAADIFVGAGSALDLALGVLTCARRTAPWALRAMILVTVGYLGGASLWLPALWSDPLGPLVKSVPAAMLALVALAMMDER